MFAQVGKDPQAKAHLQHLDDMAKGNERDMVDTFNTNLSEVADDDIDTLAKLLLGAIVPEIDEMRNSKPTTASASSVNLLAGTAIVQDKTALVPTSRDPFLFAPPAYDACGSSSSSTATTSALCDDQKKSDFHSSY